MIPEYVVTGLVVDTKRAWMCSNLFKTLSILGLKFYSLTNINFRKSVK